MTPEKIDTLAKKLYMYGNLKQEEVPVDAIIALGNMDVRIAERAAELWHHQIAPIVVAAGGRGRLTPKDWVGSEAVQFASVMYHAGVPENNVLIEDSSTNIPQNIIFSVKALESRAIKPQRLILVALPFAERRILALCKKQFPDMGFSVVAPIPKDILDATSQLLEAGYDKYQVA